MSLAQAFNQLVTDSENFLKTVDITSSGYTARHGSGPMPFWFGQEPGSGKAKYKITAYEASRDTLKFDAHHIHVQQIVYPQKVDKTKSISDHTNWDLSAWDPGIQFYLLPLATDVKLMITTKLDGCCMVIKREPGGYGIAHIQPPDRTWGQLLEITLRRKYPDIILYGKLNYGNASTVIGVLHEAGWKLYTQEVFGGTCFVGAIF